MFLDVVFSEIINTKILIWPRGYKTFSMLISAEHEFILLINVKMLTIVGILSTALAKHHANGDTSMVPESPFAGFA